jgi:hypothetical protein
VATAAALGEDLAAPLELSIVDVDALASAGAESQGRDHRGSCWEYPAHAAIICEPLVA